MKKRIIACLVCLSLALLLVLFLNVSISGAPHMAGGAICISFDKWDMLRADKIIIGFRGETYTVTDPAFIHAFSNETLAGTFHEYCCSNLNEGWVEIYRGDRLVRRMRYIANHEAFAYEADLTHWVLFGKEGHAFLSSDLRQKLQEIIGT
jgi:hypothetical protein